MSISTQNQKYSQALLLNNSIFSEGVLRPKHHVLLALSLELRTCPLSAQSQTDTTTIYKLKNTLKVPSFYILDNRFQMIKLLEGAKGLVLVQNPVELRG